MTMKAMKIFGPVAMTLFFVLQATPAAAQLAPGEVEDLLTCQEIIKRAGAKFVKVKIFQLERCADAMLALQLKLENGLITEAEFDEQLVREQRRCLKRFELIQMASTVLVDEVIEACTPVESIIFDDSDPLRFQSLLSVLGLGDIDTVEELAGFLCTGKELLVDLIAVLEVPRPFFDGLIDFFDLSLFLDSRCLAPLEIEITAVQPGT